MDTGYSNRGAAGRYGGTSGGVLDKFDRAGAQGSYPRVGASASQVPRKPLPARGARQAGLPAASETRGAEETAERQASRIGALRQTAEQLFRTTPCTGATYIILTLMLFWFIGILYGGVKFAASSSKVGSVDDLESLGEAMLAISQSQETQGWVVVIALFAMSLVFSMVYLMVIVLYNTIVNKKGPWRYMKASEVSNGQKRMQYKASMVAKGERLVREYQSDTR